MELIKVGEKTYYIKNPVNIGVYKINDKEVYLIDSGSDKDSGKKILKILDENNLQVKAIINTHSHADHIGGNKVIQDRTNCKIYSFGVEKEFINHPILEPTFLFGGYPFKDLENKFLRAKESEVSDLPLPTDLTYFSLGGHSFDMIGVKTSDDVYFLADALISKETIEKYSLFFLYDVEKYLETLTFLEKQEAKLFILSHCEATTDIKELIKVNREKIEEILNVLTGLCEEKIAFDDLLKKVFEYYNLIMNTNQYVLISSTIKSYLSYLINNNRIKYEFSDNKMYYYKV